MQAFLRRGVDVNSKDHDTGYTALHLAGVEHHLDVAKILIETGGADVDAKCIGHSGGYFWAGEFVGGFDLNTNKNDVYTSYRRLINRVPSQYSKGFPIVFGSSDYTYCQSW